MWILYIHSKLRQNESRLEPHFECAGGAKAGQSNHSPSAWATGHVQAEPARLESPFECVGAAEAGLSIGALSSGAPC